AHAAGTIGYLTGRPGVCVTTLGPGVTNLVTGVANAYLDRAPLLAFTGQRHSAYCDTLPHQRIAALQLLQPLSKWQCRLTPENAAEAVEGAWRIALDQPCGPVHLELPSDLAVAPARESRATLPIAPAPDLDEAAVVQAVRIIDQAARPVLLVGLGAQHWGAEREVRRLAEALGAAVVTTPKAKGTIPEDHPLALGVTDACGWQGLKATLRQADLFILIGCDPVELYEPWGFQAAVLHIGQVPEGNSYFPPGTTIFGQERLALSRLGELVGHRQSWPRQVLEQQAAWLSAVLTPPSQALTPHGLLLALQGLLSPEAIVTCDVGAHKQLAGQLWQSHFPKTFLVSNGLSAMGTALPAALAARLAFPERPVVCLSGDGGFKMVLGELETLVRERLPLVIVVFSDQALALIRLSQEARGYQPTGVEYGPVDYALIAQASGARGFRISHPDQCVPVLQEALECGEPAVVDAQVSAQFYLAQCRA
ncbi:MAG: thiamine pyrophosphate-binding protein, partial [Deinococcus sp.]|nr:thiamine pyrophosphate-binding protein [Deinococcus sp.]